MGRTVMVKVGADIADLRAQLRNGGAVVRQFVGELDRAAKAKHLDAVTRGAAGAGLALTGVALAAVKMRMDFDKAMSAAAAATRASAVELEALRQAALKAGADTQFSATQAAEGITALGKAGVSTSAILGGGLKGALDLAAAGQISVGEAAETAASAMTQFKLSGAAIPHLADLLAAGAGKAQGSVHDMGQALAQSGLVASQFGLKVEDTTGILAEFASAGLIGSDAGTSLKTMLLRLANPTAQTKQLMDKLGVSFHDAAGNFVGLGGVAQVLQNRLKGLTQEQRNAALGQIFGDDAIRAATILYTDGAAGVEKWRNAVNDSGFATETAAKLTDNLAGDLERLKGSLETVAIQSGGGATDGLRTLAKTANAAVDAFGELPSGVQSTITVLSGVSGVTLLAAAGFLKARGTAKDFLEELAGMGPRGAAAAKGLGRIGSIAGKLGLAGAAAVGLYEGFKLFGDWVDHFSAPVARDVDKMGQSLQDFARDGGVAGELAKTFGTNLAGLQRDIAAVTQGAARLAQLNSGGPNVYAGRGGGPAPNGAERAKLEQQIAQAKVDLAALDQALANLVNGGNATAAKIAFDQFAAATGLGLSQLPAYQQAATAAAQANTGLAQGFGTASANAKTMAGSLNDAVQAGQKLTDVWNQLHGAILSADQANLSAKQAIDAVKKAFHDNGRAVDGNSEKALRNRIAVGEAAKAAAEAAQAKYTETGSVEAASAVYNGYIGKLRKTLSQAGLTKKQINQLIGAYASMPAAVTTNVSAKGAAKAIGQVRSLKAELSSMRTNWSVTVRTRFLQFGKPYSEAGVRSGNVGGLARGGAMVPMAAGGVYPASNPPLIKFAEPETGGELYMPRRGISRGRARSLLAEGAAWYGLGITPMAAGGVHAAASGLVNVASAQPSSVITGSRLDFLEALLGARDAVAALSRALKENGRSFSFATQKGRDNRSALISGIRAAQQAAQAKYAETGSIKAANKVYDDYIHRLDAALKKMGVSAKVRREMLKAYGERPKYDTSTRSSSNSSAMVKSVSDQIAAEDALTQARSAFAWTKPSFNVKTEAGRAELTQLFSFLSAAQAAAQSLFDQTGNSKQATALYQGYVDQLKKILVASGMKGSDVDKLLKQYGRITLERNRWGGVYEHAAGGKLRDSQIASGGPTRYAWAEPETGGELFAPKYGNLAKTRSDVGWAVAHWWGGQVSWSPGPAGGGGSGAARTVVVDATIPISLGAETISRQVRLEVDTVIGEITAATVYQTA